MLIGDYTLPIVTGKQNHRKIVGLNEPESLDVKVYPGIRMAQEWGSVSEGTA